MGTRLVALRRPAGQRLAAAFAIVVVVGWVGSFYALLGTRWDGRFQTEDRLILHFLKWFLAAYGTGAVVGCAVAASGGALKVHAKVTASMLVGVVLMAAFAAEAAKADSLSLIVLVLLFWVPVAAGGLTLAGALKRM